MPVNRGENHSTNPVHQPLSASTTKGPGLYQWEKWKQSDVPGGTCALKEKETKQVSGQEHCPCSAGN